MKKLIFILLLSGIFTNISAQTEIICDEVKTATQPLKEVTYVKAIENRIGGKIEACEFELRKDMIVSTNIHPFVASLHEAYAEHRPISISPDMIWLLICQGFSIHIDNNSEELREKLVGFTDKKTLTIITDSLSKEFKLGSPKSPWRLAFPVFTDSISKYVNSDLSSLYVQSFSTTTYMEKAAYEISLMDGVSGYFQYEMSTACGIPLIKIEGTKDDWLKIKDNLNGFRGYNIDDWIDALEPIIQEFVNASDDNINHTFWTNIYKRKDESGGPYITGWIIKFFPYLNAGENKVRKNKYINEEPGEYFEGLKTNQFNNGLSKVNFIWNYYLEKYEMEFLAGFIGIRQDKKTLMLRPEIGWAIKQKGNENSSTNNINDNTSYNTRGNWVLYLIISSVIITILFFWV